MEWEPFLFHLMQKAVSKIDLKKLQVAGQYPKITIMFIVIQHLASLHCKRCCHLVRGTKKNTIN
jgi:hypothetical protein